jgi:hypothetical protein
MWDNNAIDGAAFKAANVADLALGPPRRPCS